MAVLLYTLILVAPIVIAIFGLKAFFKAKESQEIDEKDDRKFFLAYIYQYKGALTAFGFLVSLVFAIAAWNYQYEFKVIIEGELKREILADEFNLPVNTEQKKPPKPKPIQTPEIKESPQPIPDPPEIVFDTVSEEKDPVQNLVGDEDGEDEEEVFDEGFSLMDVDQYPGFPGGAAMRSQFIRRNFHFTGAEKKLYRGKKIKITVAFDVEADGKLVNIQVVRGVSKRIDAEAIRVVKMMPKFDPAIRQGVPVKVKQVVLPISIKL